MYYLYSCSDTLYLVHSEFGVTLTTRLLLHVNPQEGDRVYGYIEDDDLTWLSADTPRILVDIAFFIEPRPFLADRQGKLWALLHKVDAVTLHKHWTKTEAYKEAPDNGKPNYFRNSVDAFKYAMETKWFK